MFGFKTRGVSAAASGWAGWAKAHPEFWSLVNPITTRGQIMPPINTSTPGFEISFENLVASLLPPL